MLEIINRAERVFISISIMFATSMVLVNVVLRMMGSGIIWSEELIRYLLIALTFIGMSVCAKDEEHVSIEFVPQLLKGKARRALMVFINLVSLIFSVMLTWYSFQLLMFSVETAQLTTGIGMPFYIIYAVMPLSGLLLIMRYTHHLIKLITQKDSQDNEKQNENIAHQELMEN